MAGERLKADHAVPAPDVAESESLETSAVRVVSLEPLVRMKLTSFLTKDREHLRDMLDIGLIDASWTASFIPELAARLQHLIDTPGQ